MSHQQTATSNSSTGVASDCGYSTWSSTASTVACSIGSGAENCYQYLVDLIESHLKNASPLKLSLFGSTLSLFLITLYYSRKLSTPTMIFRSLVQCFVWKNKLIGMTVCTAEEKKKINESLLYVGSYIRPSHVSLDIEAQTIASLVSFSSAKTGQHLLDKYGLRKAMQHQILSPPITSRNTLKLERIPTLRNSLLAKLKDSPDKKKVVFYVHGGGGFGNCCDGLQASSMVEYLNGRDDHAIHSIFSVAYRLMGLDEKERSFKTKFASSFEEQVQDCMDGYKWIIEKYNPKDIVLMGDSFGGAVVANLLAKIGAELGIEKQPYMAVTLSGFFDTTVKSFRENYDIENSVIVAPNNIDIMEELYPNVPESMVPIHFDSSVISTFKDTKLLIVYSNHEEVTVENKQFASLLQSQHPNVTVIAEDGHVHGYPLFHSYSPGIKRTMDKIIDLVSQ